MAKGATIVVKCADNSPNFVEGFIGAGLAPLPGTVMQIDFTVAAVGGRFTWKRYTPGTDGNRPRGPWIILRENEGRGGVNNLAYSAGDHCYGYIPQEGDELNLLVADASGTATVSAGTTLIAENATGYFVPTTGSPQTEPATSLEDSTFPGTSGALTWCYWNG